MHWLREAWDIRPEGSKMITVTYMAPEPIKSAARPRVFLAGSIEMGAAENWQAAATEALEGEAASIFNPRRDDWDSSWVQSINDAKFREQVNWELEAMYAADVVFMHFCADTKSPITLLEFGLNICTGKLVVVCPDGYWRKGNVEVTAARYCNPVHNTLKRGLDEVIARLRLAA